MTRPSHGAAALTASLAAVLTAVSLRLPGAGPLLPVALAVAWAALSTAARIDARGDARGDARSAASVTALVATTVALGPASVAAGAVAPLAPWTAPLIALALAAPFALVGPVFARTAGAPVRSVLAVAGAWTAIETAWGAPWLLGAWAMPAMTLGFAASSGPWVAGLAPAGPAFVTLVAWTVGAALHAAAARATALAAAAAGGATGAGGAAVVTAVLAASVASAPPSEAAEIAGTAETATLPLRIVQTAAPASAQAAFALDPASAERRIADLVRRSSGRGTEGRLAIWPEVALPGRIAVDGAPRLPNGVPRTLAVLTGAVTERSGRPYNSALLLPGSGAPARVVADKRRLVPLTERGLTPGEPAEPFPWRGVRLAVAICWEVAFPNETRTLTTGADALIVLADDAYAPHGPVPELHLRLARLRAAELGLPVVFVQATGPSAAIGPDGRVLARAEAGDRTPLDVDLPVGAPPPFHPLRGAAPFGPPVAIAALLTGLLPPRSRQVARKVPPREGGEAGGP